MTKYTTIKKFMADGVYEAVYDHVGSQLQLVKDGKAWTPKKMGADEFKDLFDKTIKGIKALGIKYEVITS